MDTIPSIMVVLVLSAAVGCRDKSSSRSGAEASGIGAPLVGEPPPHAFTSGGSPTTAATRFLANGKFKTLAALGQIAGPVKTRGSLRLKDGFLPGLSVRSGKAGSGKADVAPTFVAADRTIVSAGPGPGNPAVATLFRGARVTVAGDAGGSGERRWISDPVWGWLDAADLSARTPERTLAGSLPEDRYVSAGVLPVRLGPDGAYPEEARLYRGTLVRVLGDGRGWSLLEGPVPGYVETAGVTAGGTTNSQPPTSNKPPTSNDQP